MGAENVKKYIPIRGIGSGKGGHAARHGIDERGIGGEGLRQDGQHEPVELGRGFEEGVQHSQLRLLRERRQG